MTQIFSRQCKKCGGTVSFKKENGVIVDISNGRQSRVYGRYKTVPGKIIRCLHFSPYQSTMCINRRLCLNSMLISKFKEITA